jgi:hypothetical protein
MLRTRLARQPVMVFASAKLSHDVVVGENLIIPIGAKKFSGPQSAPPPPTPINIDPKSTSLKPRIKGALPGCAPNGAAGSNPYPVAHIEVPLNGVVAHSAKYLAHPIPALDLLLQRKVIEVASVLDARTTPIGMRT